MTFPGVKVRFAPSPTGRLHVGNIRVALLNWLFAMKAGGEIILRMDDTDEERSTEAFERGIVEDLTWLGLVWDVFIRQSARMDRYEFAAGKLRASGRLYPCWETQEELELKRRIRMGQGRPPVYDRAALALSQDEQAALIAQGKQPHWRFRLLDEVVAWSDLARGDVRFEPGHLSDPVLVREDGRPLYTLSSVVDDGEMWVSHVIRGEDHVANTAVQIQLFQALGFEVPDFAHLPLLVDADGKALSKRDESLSIQIMRDQGTEARAILSYLAKLGSGLAADGTETLGHLARQIDLGGFGKASPRFDPRELEALNAKVLHHLSFAEVAERLQAMGLAQADAEFWQAVRGNLERFADVAVWWRVARGTVTPPDLSAKDKEFLAQAATLLPAPPWGPDIWKLWTSAVKDATGRKGKALFLPLRLALTGEEHGPELAALLPLIGRDKALERLQMAAN